MAAYTYTGTLTDIGVQVLTSRYPRLTVRPEHGVWGLDGVVSSARRTVTVNPATGAFTMTLVASADLTPPAKYVLEVVLFDQAADGTPIAGWDAWTFTAVAGGGNIADMADAPATRLFIGPPWPATPIPGAYFDTTTNDLGFYSLED